MFSTKWLYEFGPSWYTFADDEKVEVAFLLSHSDFLIPLFCYLFLTVIAILLNAFLVSFFYHGFNSFISVLIEKIYKKITYKNKFKVKMKLFSIIHVLHLRTLEYSVFILQFFRWSLFFYLVCYAGLRWWPYSLFTLIILVVCNILAFWSGVTLNYKKKSNEHYLDSKKYKIDEKRDKLWIYYFSKIRMYFWTIIHLLFFCSYNILLIVLALFISSYAIYELLIYLVVNYYIHFFFVYYTDEDEFRSRKPEVNGEYPWWWSIDLDKKLDSITPTYLWGKYGLLFIQRQIIKLKKLNILLYNNGKKGPVPGYNNGKKGPFHFDKEEIKENFFKYIIGYIINVIVFFILICLYFILFMPLKISITIFTRFLSLFTLDFYGKFDSIEFLIFYSKKYKFLFSILKYLNDNIIIGIIDYPINIRARLAKGQLTWYDRLVIRLFDGTFERFISHLERYLPIFKSILLEFIKDILIPFLKRSLKVLFFILKWFSIFILILVFFLHQSIWFHSFFWALLSFVNFLFTECDHSAAILFWKNLIPSGKLFFQDQLTFRPVILNYITIFIDIFEKYYSFIIEKFFGDFLNSINHGMNMINDTSSKISYEVGSILGRIQSFMYFLVNVFCLFLEILLVFLRHTFFIFYCLVVLLYTIIDYLFFMNIMLPIHVLKSILSIDYLYLLVKYFIELIIFYLCMMKDYMVDTMLDTITCVSEYLKKIIKNGFLNWLSQIDFRDNFTYAFFFISNYVLGVLWTITWAVFYPLYTILYVLWSVIWPILHFLLVIVWSIVCFLVSIVWFILCFLVYIVWSILCFLVSIVWFILCFLYYVFCFPYYFIKYFFFM